MGLISRVSSRTYRKISTMPKRKLQLDDLVALDQDNQILFKKSTENAVKRAKKVKPESKKSAVLHIKQLPRVLDEQDLRDYFIQFGKVKRIKLARSSRTGNSKGYAFVEFKEEKTAEICAKINERIPVIQLPFTY